MEEAVRQQEDLLAEFEKIVNELNNVLANLEGSTLVKRLKAASREQYRVAGRIGDQLDAAFGSSESSRSPSQKKVFSDLSDVEEPEQSQRLADYGRHASLFRAPPLRSVQDGLGGDEDSRTSSAVCGNSATTWPASPACR